MGEESAENAARESYEFEEEVLQTKPPAQLPLDFALTKRHVLLLYPNCVIALSRLSFKFVSPLPASRSKTVCALSLQTGRLCCFGSALQSTSLALPAHLYGKTKQLLSDSTCAGAMVLTTEFVADLPISSEDANVWRLLLAQSENIAERERPPWPQSELAFFSLARSVLRGAAENFAGAVACCANSRQREYVHRAHAAFLVSRDQWVEAAAVWALARSARFEDVCGLLLDEQRCESDPQRRQLLAKALLVYLSCKLRQLGAAGGAGSKAGRVPSGRK